MNAPENSSLRRRTYEQTYVRSLFDSIAYRYDALNHILSSGIDILWRRRAVNLLKPLRPRLILDVATGTADFAIAAARIHPEHITGIDISPKMLERGKNKISAKHLDNLITLEIGEAEHLRFPPESFDAVTAAFGVRNFSDLEMGLSEFHRILRRKGAAVILEFSTPAHVPAALIYRFYINRILPRIGGWLTRSRSAYEYLPSTMSEFPDSPAFSKLLLSAGFGTVRCFPQTFGIATIYLAIK